METKPNASAIWDLREREKEREGNGGFKWFSVGGYGGGFSWWKGTHISRNCIVLCLFMILLLTTLLLCLVTKKIMFEKN